MAAVAGPEPQIAPQPVQARAVANVLVHVKAEQNQGHQRKAQIKDTVPGWGKAAVEELDGNVPLYRRDVEKGAGDQHRPEAGDDRGG